MAFPVITRSEQALDALHCYSEYSINSQYLVELTYKILDCFFNISQRKNLCLTLADTRYHRKTRISLFEHFAEAT